jgi:hypothetical protein
LESTVAISFFGEERLSSHAIKSTDWSVGPIYSMRVFYGWENISK